MDSDNFFILSRLLPRRRPREIPHTQDTKIYFLTGNPTFHTSRVEFDKKRSSWIGRDPIHEMYISCVDQQLHPL